MKHVGICLTMLFTLCLTLLPWWYRSYSITGRFIPTTLQVGASLYDGLGPQADGSSHMEFVPQFIAEQQAADAAGEASPLRTFEERLDRRMQTASVAWAKEHPQRVAELAGIKFLRMWSPWPNGGELGSFTTRLAIAAGYLPLLVLSLWGVYRYAWRDWSFLLLVLPGVYFTLLHVVFVSSIRYRQPALLPLAILGAAVLVSGTVANVRKITPLLCVRKAASRKR